MTGAIHGLGSAGVSSAGAVEVKVTSHVVNTLSAGAYYTEGYTSVNHTENFDSKLLPPRSAALGGYMYSAKAMDHGMHETSGWIRDDVVGEVPDKAVCVTGSGHLGGLKTEKALYEGDLKVTLPLWVKTVDGAHDPSPSGPKLVASNHSNGRRTKNSLTN